MQQIIVAHNKCKYEKCKKKGKNAKLYTENSNRNKVQLRKEKSRAEINVFFFALLQTWKKCEDYASCGFGKQEKRKNGNGTDWNKWKEFLDEILKAKDPKKNDDDGMKS